MRIVFMGSPAFAIPSLQAMLDNQYNIVAVITAPDKPSGRGLKMTNSPVKEFAIEKGLKILQPEKLKEPEFLSQLKSLSPDLQIVVAFRMLPEAVWQFPPLGTFNLHASLLPQYRGAAPINHAIINGEKETGITTFFLQHEIDTGDIILQQKVSIGENETAGELHDRMSILGAGLVVKTVEVITLKKISAIKQKVVNESEIKTAPKITRTDCRIDLSKKSIDIFNHIRGLSPHPGAFGFLQLSDGKKLLLKILRCSSVLPSFSESAGNINTDNKNFLRLQTSSGSIDVVELQLEGRKKMNVKDFLKGFQFSEKDRII